MPVKLRKPKARHAQITDEAKAIFADAIKLQDIRWNCVGSVSCRSTSVNQQCPECEKYHDLKGELNGLLGIKPWETSPLMADSKTPPDWMRANPLQSGYWLKAWALRCELEVKAGSK